MKVVAMAFAGRRRKAVVGMVFASWKQLAGRRRRLRHAAQQKGGAQLVLWWHQCLQRLCRSALWQWSQAVHVESTQQRMVRDALLLLNRCFESEVTASAPCGTARCHVPLVARRL